jgi:hypothetical protein
MTGSAGTEGTSSTPAGGLVEYLVRGFGYGHITGVVGWLLLGANAIITGFSP